MVPTAVRTPITATASVWPLKARTTPATAGPTRLAPPSVHPVITLAAVSSSGVRTMAGSRAAWAGRVTVRVSALTVASR